MTTSALYDARVYHARRTPKKHGFHTRLELLWLDLDELPDLFRGRWLWSHLRPNLAFFRRADYLGSKDVPLKQAVQDRVEKQLGFRPDGPVRVLTQLRTLGYVFNPVSFYYCYDRGEVLQAIVAEITNTPWKERFQYVLDARGSSSETEHTFRFPKAFHVSPFFDMNQVYEWRFRAPGENLEVHMRNLVANQPVFLAGLVATRREINGRSLAWALLSHPLQTFRVHAAIYWHAALLWRKRVPFFVHPSKRQPSQTPS
ncbi:MAG TPA: DUF1365 domain-containing protein [Planctomycetota bacterium]|nr:DUF1365 domain-containing protein [Planctomycetota bacterium]